MGKLVEIKTRQTDSSVEAFLNTVADEQKRKDSFVLLKMMEKATKEKPKMWGASMIGFGKLKYTSPATGREVEWFKIGFSPRKANLSLHLAGDMRLHTDAFKILGKYKSGAGCLYINKLEDVDIKVLTGIINATVKAK